MSLIEDYVMICTLMVHLLLSNRQFLTFNFVQLLEFTEL